MKSYLKFLSRNKAYTIIDVLGLALSFMFLIIIGAYTWQENHLDTGHSKLDRIYFLGIEMKDSKTIGNHWKMIEKLKSQFPEIESGTGYGKNNAVQSMPDGTKIITDLAFVDSTFFSIFDFPLAQGDRATALGSRNSIVVTRDYATKMWGSENPMGKSVKFEDMPEPLVVTGVIEGLSNTILEPRDKSNVDALVNFRNEEYFNVSLIEDRMGNATGTVVILLAKEGYDLRDSEEKFDNFAKDFFWILQLADYDAHLKVLPFAEYYFSDYTCSTGSDTVSHGDRKMVDMLFLFGLVILAFALMNYVNLTVAISGNRAKEMATRRLLGESRVRIMMRLISESTLLCILSFVIGSLLAIVALPYAEQLLRVKISVIGCLTPLTISISVGVLLLMGVLAGMVPAWYISSAKPIDVVRGTFRRHAKMMFSKVFIVVQNVVTIVMIASAVTMFLQVRHLIDAPMGYDADMVMSISNPGDKDQAKVFMQRVEQIPGVEKVSAACGSPVQGGNNFTFGDTKGTHSFQIFTGDENFLDVLGIGLDRDNRTTGNNLFLNHTAIADLALTDESEGFKFGDTILPITGILTDFKIRNVLQYQNPILLQIFSVNEFWPWNFLIRVNGDREQVYDEVKKVYSDIYHIEYGEAYPYLHQQLERQFLRERNLQKIVALFAAIAILISMLGLVAMSTYFVQQRSREIAVKKVFGCDSGLMLRNLVLSFLAYVGIAFVVSVPIIYYVMNTWLAEYSYRIDLYWWIYAISGAVCALVSVLAVFVQARRAANQNPIVSLYQN